MIKYKDKKVELGMLDDNISSYIPKKKEKVWEIDRNYVPDDENGNSLKGTLYYAKLGSGGQGNIYILCNKKDQTKPCGMIIDEYIPCEKCDYVLKVYHEGDYYDKPNFKTLPLIYKLCSDLGLSSPITDSWELTINKEKRMVYAMKRFDITLKEYFHINNESYVQQYCGLCKTLLLINKLHNIGIVHRDTKPENFMFDKDGRLYVIDLDTAEFLIKENIDEAISKILKDYFILEYYLKFLTNFPPKKGIYGGTFYYLDLIKVRYKEKIMDPLKSLQARSLTFEQILDYENKAIRNFIEDIPIPSNEFLREYING